MSYVQSMHQPRTSVNVSWDWRLPVSSGKGTEARPTLHLAGVTCMHASQNFSLVPILSLWPPQHMRGQCHGGRHGQIIHWQRETLHARSHGRTGGRELRSLQHSELLGN
jgi:hypothetical protein